jgi:hypothetical protein
MLIALRNPPGVLLRKTCQLVFDKSSAEMHMTLYDHFKWLVHSIHFVDSKYDLAISRAKELNSPAHIHEPAGFADLHITVVTSNQRLN